MADERLASNSVCVHPLETFDGAVCSRVMPASEDDSRSARWLLAKRLAGHSCKMRWDRAEAIIRNAATAGEGERIALRDFFAELDGPEIAQVMRTAGATPRRMAELFHELAVRQWQAVLWVNQFSSRRPTPAMDCWDKFAQGSVRFGEPLPPEPLGPR